MIQMYSSRNPRIFTQHVASNMINNAAQFYLERNHSAALILYTQSISLLNELCLTDLAQGYVNEQQRAEIYIFSEVRNVTAPIFVPMNSTYDEKLEPCSNEFLAFALMYNLFLLLKRSGEIRDAQKFLELAHDISIRWFDGGDLHPTMRLSMRYHIADMVYNYGDKDQALIMFVDAMEIGQENLQLQLNFIFASVCTRVGGLLLDSGYIADACNVFKKASEIYEMWPMQQFVINRTSNTYTLAPAA